MPLTVTSSITPASLSAIMSQDYCDIDEIICTLYASLPGKIHGARQMHNVISLGNNIELPKSLL